MVERTLISFPSQLQLIERLQHLLYLSSSMVFISGEQGSGKSTLIEQLSNQLPDKTQQAFISIAEPISIAHIRQQIICQFFENPLFDADDPLSNSLMLLTEKQGKDVARVVVIDNADLLPAQLLIELAEVIKQKSLLTENEINFILLSDEANNKQMISDLKLSSSVCGVAALTFKLAPLSVDEAKQLLNHRFIQIGYSPRVLHKDALNKKLSCCQGIPEKILILAAELNSGEVDNNKASWLTTRFPAILLMLLLVAIATLLGFYLYPKFVNNKLEVATVIETEVVLLEEINATEIVTEEASDSESTGIFALQWSNDKQSVTDNQLSVGIADTEERVTISEAQLFAITTAQSQQTKLIAEKNIKLPAFIIEAESNNKTENTFEVVEEIAQSSTVKLPSTSIKLPSTPIKPEIEMVKPLILITESPVSELVSIEEGIAPDVVIVQDVVELQETPKAEVLKPLQSIAVESRDFFTPAANLLAVDPNRYTLQLSGMSTEKSLQAFIKQHKLPRQNVYLYKTMRNQKLWYVVIYGQFESRQAASRAAKNLPSTLSQFDSWIKKYASVHQDLQLNE
jgi:DamX protein